MNFDIFSLDHRQLTSLDMDSRIFLQERSLDFFLRHFHVLAFSLNFFILLINLVFKFLVLSPT